MKHITYFLRWICTVYSITFIWDLTVTGFLYWFYSWKFDELTPRLYLWGWLFCMALITVAVYMIEDGAARVHYAGGKTYPLAATVASQIVALVVYIALAFVTNFKGLLYFPSVYLAYVINEFDANIIVNSTERTWAIVLMVLHGIYFAAVGLVAYLRERKRLVDKYERAMSSANETQTA